MMDGRFDQHFAELFASSRDDAPNDQENSSLLPLALACILGLAFFGGIAGLT